MFSLKSIDLVLLKPLDQYGKLRSSNYLGKADWIGIQTRQDIQL